MLFFALRARRSICRNLKICLGNWDAGLRIEAKSKILYHAACAMASNLVCGLVQHSQDLLTVCGFSPEQAAEALKPLISSNVKHILEDGAIAALTGPAERCDVQTVKKHMASMPSEDTKELYKLLSLRLADMAETKNPQRDYEPLREALLQTEGRKES